MASDQLTELSSAWYSGCNIELDVHCSLYDLELLDHSVETLDFIVKNSELVKRRAVFEIRNNLFKTKHTYDMSDEDNSDVRRLTYIKSYVDGVYKFDDKIYEILFGKDRYCGKPVCRITVKPHMEVIMDQVNNTNPDEDWLYIDRDLYEISEKYDAMMPPGEDYDYSHTPENPRWKNIAKPWDFDGEYRNDGYCHFSKIPPSHPLYHYGYMIDIVESYEKANNKIV
jgi:hypothetical protein